jgi:hypothetical protein
MASAPLWLERSRGLPVTIAVTLIEPLIGDDHETCLLMLLQLREHFHRSRSLTVLILYDVYFNQLFPEELHASLPVLETMEIYLDREWWTNDRASCDQFNVPSIRSLRLHGNAAEWETKRWAAHIRITLRQAALADNVNFAYDQDSEDA